MKTTLLPIPIAAPKPAEDAGAYRENPGEGDTFAAVLDRQQQTAQPRCERCGTNEAEAASPEKSVDEVPVETEDAPTDEAPASPTPLLPTLALPLLPYQPMNQPRVAWSPMESGEEPEAPVASAEVEAGGQYDWVPASPMPALAGGQRYVQPAQTAAAIFAAPAQEVSLLAAPNPAGTQPVAMDAKKISSPLRASEPTAVPTQQPVNRAPVFDPGTGALLAPEVSPVATNPAFTVESAGVAPALTPRAVAPVATTPRSEIAASETPQVEMPEPIEAPQPRPIFREVLTTERQILRPLDDTLASTGIPAAKGGDIMPAITIPAPNRPASAKPVARVSEAVERVSAAPLDEVAAPMLTGDAPDIALPVAPATEKRPSQEQRSMPDAPAEMSRTPATNVSPRVEGRLDAVAARTPGLESIVKKEAGAETEVETLPVSFGESRTEASAPTSFAVATSPDTERTKAEATAPAAPIERAEIVRLAERTADAAVRLRATGSERIEVSLQLASGDRLTIQLQFANGEVTPHFRTNSEGLRLALEQHWSQFTERASDRGVRMTPPVFDVNSSSSNMTDLSQQRHGRDTAQAQAELFPHLPRRARPPRVLAAAPLETAPAAVGVRAYA